jgi:hypothetical protein
MRNGADVARLLGATGPGAWALAALFGVTYIVIAFWVDPGYTGSPLGGLALLLMVLAAVALVLPQLSPLSHVAAAGIVAASVFATAAGLWQLDLDQWRGWITWYIGASSYLAFILALRGKFWWGVASLLAVTVVAMHWTAVKSGDALAGINLTYNQLILFAAGSFFALWLRRTADRIVAFQETRLRRESAEGARSAAEEARAREIRAIRKSAGTALERIAEGRVSEKERREHLLLEAELRDRIRGRALASGPLLAEVRAARARGVDVALLDDIRDSAPSADALVPAIAWAALRIATVPAGSATVRLALAEGATVVTFGTSEGETATYLVPGAA